MTAAMSTPGRPSTIELREHKLIPGYTLRKISYEEYRSLCERLEDKIFGNYFTADLSVEQKQIDPARSRMLEEGEGSLMKIVYGIYHGETAVGFHFSSQLPDKVVLMRDTGILPEHQGKGLYKAFLSVLLQQLEEAGFREAVSFHKATNNQVIVPKLKAGFVIGGFQICVDGYEVKLSYPFSSLERELLKCRSGQIRPEGIVRSALKL